MKQAYPDIWTTNSSAKCISLEAFYNSPLAKTPAGKLFLELLAEDTWSTGFVVSVQLYSSPNSISIGSPFFIDHLGCDYITIEEVDGKFPSMVEIAGVVLKEMEKHRNSIAVVTHSLRAKLSDIERAGMLVRQGLARKAILAKVRGAILGERVFFSDNCYLFDDCGEQTLFVRDSDVLKGDAPVYRIGIPLKTLRGIDMNATELSTHIANAQLVEAAQ